MTVAATYTPVARKVCRVLSGLRYRALGSLEVPGVEVYSGKALKFGRLRRRVLQMRKRRNMLRRVQKTGQLACRFAKAAVPSALMYGVGVHGAPPLVVNAMRAALRGSWYEAGKACLLYTSPSPRDRSLS
eukprot:2107364-Pyramimonas_sp.AAC.1